ncbi:hypothetical protein OUE_1122 [Helicobacter pylori R030b]|nr:hypothetical protein OUE_1122 [Helicobacter pylori R030b]
MKFDALNMHGADYSIKAFFLSFGENFRIFVLFGAFYFVCVVLKSYG